MINELVSYSNKEIYILNLHKSSEPQALKSIHYRNDYTYEARYFLKFVYSIFYNIHNVYIYFICTIRDMYIYTECIYINMNTTIPQIVQDTIMGKMVFFKDGQEMIALGNYALDFKQTYVFLGFTKNKTQVILGDIHTYGELQQNGKREIKYRKRFAKVELVHSAKVEYTGTKGNFVSTTVPYSYYQLHTDGFRYSEKIMEIEN